MYPKNQETRAMRYHRTDTGSHASGHVLMHQWMLLNPNASFEEYTKKGKELGIDTYNRDAYQQTGEAQLA